MFKLESKNAILHDIKLLAQKDGGNEYVTAHKLTFICEADGEMAHTLMGPKEEHERINWWEGKYGDSVFVGISGMVKSKAEFDDCNVSFKGVSLKDVPVKDFYFIPENGYKVKIKLTVLVCLDDKQIVKFERWYKKGGKLVIKTESVFDPSGDEEKQTEIPMEE